MMKKEVFKKKKCERRNERNENNRKYQMSATERDGR